MTDWGGAGATFEFGVTVRMTADTGEVLIGTEDGEPLPFLVMMMAAEYLTHLAATHSAAGYEEALEMIRKGAMTYRNVNPRDGGATERPEGP